MKKIILFLIVTIFTLSNQTFAAQSPAAPLMWSWELQIWWQIWFWESIWSWAYLTDTNTFSWWFQMNSTEIQEYCTFNTWVANQPTVDGAGEVSWFAFCQESWWIAFDPLDWNHTTYDKTTSSFWWFAWSEALWWLTLQWVELDTTEPTIDTSIFMANDNKTISDIVSDNSWSNNVETIITSHLDNWTTTTNTLLSNTHNFQTVLPWNYTISTTDPSWNTSTATVQVIANTSNIVNTSTHYDDFTNLIAANWQNYFNLNLLLKDQYWNPIISVSPIRDVKLQISFDNNLEHNQFDWLPYPSVTISWATINWWAWVPSWSSSAFNDYTNIELSENLDWIYNIDLTSIAPSNAWYSFATWWINLSTFTLSLSWSLNLPGSQEWNWSWNEINLTSKYNLNSLAFTPIFKVTDVSYASEINIWNITNFEVLFNNQTTPWIANFRLYNLLDLIDNDQALFTIQYNYLSSYQSPAFTSQPAWVTNKWYWYSTWTYIWNETDIFSSISFPFTNNIFSNTSNYYFEWYPASTDSYNFSWIPKIIYASPTTAQTKYRSIVEYKINGEEVQYYSFEKTTWWTVNNNIVKIWWSINEDADTFERNDEESYVKIENELNKTEIKAMIWKNVAKLTAWMSDWQTVSKVHFEDGNFTLSDLTWDNSIETLIVEWNLLINTNIVDNPSQLKWVIVIEDDSWNGWNIYMTNNVKNIDAIIYADNSVISGPSIWIFYTDDEKNNQLLVNWSIISDNTIGWADMVPMRCPLDITCNTFEEAKRYDFNYFRSYINWLSGLSASDVPVWEEEYAFIINYDSRIQSNPPKWFKK